MLLAINAINDSALPFRMKSDLEAMDSRLSEVVGHSLLPHPSGLPGAHFVDQVIMPWLLDDENGDQITFECMCKKVEDRSAALSRDPDYSLNVKLSAPWSVVGSPATSSPITWSDLIWAWFCLGDWEALVLEKKRADVELAFNTLCPKV